MPLSGNPKKDIPELVRANRQKPTAKKRSKTQIIAIALAEKRRKKK